MYKVGDIVICKNFPRNVNGIDRDKDPNMTIGKPYIIIRIEDEHPKLDLQMLQILGEKGPAWYWSDYFYNKNELRKFKLDKIWMKHKENITIVR
jgi:hypothetical protein